MSRELDTFNDLQNAYNASTINENRFIDAVNSIEWDDKFSADGEFYFIKRGFAFTTPSLDPFACDWKPSAVFSDGSLVEFA